MATTKQTDNFGEGGVIKGDAEAQDDDVCKPLLPSQQEQKKFLTDEEIAKDRKIGWVIMAANFLVVAAVITYYSVTQTKKVAAMFDPFLASSVRIWAIYTFCKNGVVYGVGYLAKWLLFKYWLKVTPEEWELSIANRSNWKEDDLGVLLDSLGTRRLKIADCLNRRFSHVMDNIVYYVFIAAMVKSPVNGIQMCLLNLFIVPFFAILLERYDWWLSRFIFRGARMRDGRLGWFNLVVVWCTEDPCQLLATFLVVFDSHWTHAQFFLKITFMPVIVGDTMGEVIGAFWGRLRFPVYGIGEINYKTVEGAIATFLSNLLSTAIVVYTSSPHENVFVIPNMAVAAIVSVVGTIAELAAPRGTDNGVILLACLGTCFAFRSSVQVV